MVKKKTKTTQTPPAKGKKKQQAPSEEVKENPAAPVPETGREEPIKETRASLKIPALDWFPIVGVGSSAGGLEALEVFFTHLPADSGMAFIVVSHTSAEHESMLPMLIKRKTRMEVHEIEEGMAARPNHVYLPPSNKDAMISGGVFHLEDIKKPIERRLPIDHLFKSLGLDRQEMAACIILSGTGSDGSAGLKAVKENGGMVMAQDLNSAKFRGMPQNAIETGLADYISPPRAMPDQLIQYFDFMIKRDHAKELTEEERFQRNVNKVVTMLGGRTGHDFSYYKKGTLIRRIERRMSIHHIDSMDKYIAFLQRNDDELDILFQELLIGVTNFFRDPEAFAYLRKEVLPDLLTRKEADSSFRVWVCGCSTGEEVYSINILLREAMEQLKISRELQVFGTDIDTRAIEKAREGTYPENIVADVSRERLVKYFVSTGDSYRIRKDLRDSVVFSVQDVMRDPPFSRLDMLVCRNLLIYLEASAQKKLMPLFHYTLKPNGVLFLGVSETVGRSTDLFSTVSKKWNIYRRKEADSGARAALEFPTRGRFAPPAVEKGEAAPAPRREEDLPEAVKKILLEQFSPPCVVVNRDGEISYIIGRTGKYLEPPQGRPAMNILTMAREGLRFELGSALRKVADTNEPIVREGLQVPRNGGMHSFKLIVSPIKDQPFLANMLLVLFVDQPAPPVRADKGQEPGESRQATYNRIVDLENALQKSQEEHKIAREELETSNEELKSVNEEMQSSYEELQSSNEELESSKEELQSLNEELSTVNSELHEKIQQLSESYEASNNLLNATQIALVVLDNDLAVMRFTNEATKLINLISSDVGRPLDHVSTNIEYGRLLEDVREVLERLAPREAEIATRDGHWYLMRIVPYRTPDNRIEGAVLTFINIDQQKNTQRSAIHLDQEKNAAARIYAETVLDSLHESVVVLDNELRILSSNRTFNETFKISPENAGGQFIYKLGNGELDIPRLREKLTRLVTRGIPLEGFPVEHGIPGKEKKSLVFHGSPLLLDDSEEMKILLTIDDITDKERMSPESGEENA